MGAHCSVMSGNHKTSTRCKYLNWGEFLLVATTCMQFCKGFAATSTTPILYQNGLFSSSLLSGRLMLGRKRAHGDLAWNDDRGPIPTNMGPCLRASIARDAQSLADGVELPSNGVILPWVGYGTYKLGKADARPLTLEALKQGYRCIDTAFIYGGETTETQVGLAIQDALHQGILERKELVVQTKHWRSYHGYEPTLQCLELSLKRLQLEWIDVWLMHWPGPAWNTMARRKDEIAKNGPWQYASYSKEDLPVLRSDTWRAMEKALQEGKVKAIGVSNFSVAHLERLKQTATIWPPAINQIECHPLYPQKELLEYCAKEGIVVQAYASLGGQDAGKAFWKKVYPPKRGEQPVTKLLNTPPVLNLSKEVDRTPAQVLLRWALEKNLALVPKSSSPQRMSENANIFDFSLSIEQMDKLESSLAKAIADAADQDGQSVADMARLCWRNDPLRLLDFD